MNLLVKTIYLFLLLLAGKMYVPKYIEGTIPQNLAFIVILFLGNIIYRISVNYYFKKSGSIKDLMVEAFYRTILVIVGIVAVNYLISKPEILGKYGIEVPSTNLYTSTAVSLVPFVLSKALLSPDI
jgi:hypothetical protein